MSKVITVTSPLLPDLNEFKKLLEDIWNRRWITNSGHYHEELERALAGYLGVKYISLFTNGTLPLITALKALDLSEGEVITTPYSFAATAHSILWSGLKPVFADVDPATGNINPALIEKAITEKTVAVMPVHVYGTPCDTDAIKKIAEKYSLKVIYDAAHCFGVTVNGKSVLEAGDMSAVSFHATKVYNTVEGGALICSSAEMKDKIDHLKNFGFSDEVTVEGAGINSKMDELRSAYGLLNLKLIDEAIARRKRIAQLYRKALKDIPGLRFLSDVDGVRHNYSYFPVFISENDFGMSRDALYEKMKQYGIFCRRYFYPLISDFPVYRSLESAKKENLPEATELAEQVLCLPIYESLSDEELQKVISAVTEKN
ncbi:MAG: DegT/DnrJ/EryC1/StrS family aminotransferase [Treponema sp.]|nr:DegT/DnrJ/EryC1/StrS family aminotransferase [Treponema sp.]